MQLLAIERIDERTQYVFLTHHLIKETGPPFACKYLITHLNFWPTNKVNNAGMITCNKNNVSVKMEMAPTSITSAHESVTTVAPFRAWRGSWRIIAWEPVGATITDCPYCLRTGGILTKYWFISSLNLTRPCLVAKLAFSLSMYSHYG